MTGTELATPPARLLSPTFAFVVLSGLGYFTSVGMLLPVIPRYVEDRLGGGGVEVGVAVGAFAVSAALLRPFAGRWGDRVGRRPLAVVGALVAACSVLCYGSGRSWPGWCSPAS